MFAYPINIYFDLLAKFKNRGDFNIEQLLQEIQVFQSYESNYLKDNLKYTTFYNNIYTYIILTCNIYLEYSYSYVDVLSTVCLFVRSIDR